MLTIEPRVRAASALALAAATFLVASQRDTMVLYGLLLLVCAATGTLRAHLRFALGLAAPLLGALLLVWGVWLGDGPIPRAGMSGWQYAVSTWLRLLSFSAVLQAGLLPLLRHPMHLKSFLAACRLPAWLALLMIGALVFVPELQRRIARIVDARRAQGHALRGVRGLMQLPSLITPLVASLLDSAVQRAELWSHRGVLLEARAATRAGVSTPCTLACAAAALGGLAFGLASHGGFA